MVVKSNDRTGAAIINQLRPRFQCDHRTDSIGRDPLCTGSVHDVDYTCTAFVHILLVAVKLVYHTCADRVDKLPSVTIHSSY